MEQSTAVLGWLSLAESAKIGTNVLVHLYLFLRFCNKPVITKELSSQYLSVCHYIKLDMRSTDFHKVLC